MLAASRRLCFVILLLGFLAAGPSPGWACSIPVFRYALERWAPEPYGVVVFHKGPLAVEDQAIIDWLGKAASQDAAFANIEVHTVDLAKQQEEAVLALWKAESTTELPWMVVLYPRSAGVEKSAWSGRLRAEAAKALVDSPARREIVKHLVGGASAAWLLLESGDREKDEAAAKTLQRDLKKMEEVLELPVPMDYGFYQEEEVQEGKQEEKQEQEQGLKVFFPLVRVCRADKAEGVFIRMLVGIEEDLKKLKEPIAFPFFGQGRALYALVGKGINTDNIGESCAFLIGPCACRVKMMNPGIDLLMMADWSAALEGREVQQVELPPLVSAASLAPPEKMARVPPAQAPQQTGGTLRRNLLLAVVAGIVIVGAACLLVMRKSWASRS